MKKNNFIGLLCLLLSTMLVAQESGPTIYVDLDIEGHGKINRVELPDESGTILGSLLFEKNAEDRYDIGFDFSQINASTLSVEFRSHGRTLYRETVPGGPDAGFTVVGDGSLYKASFAAMDEEAWWIGILAVAYCCIEIEIGNNSENGVTTTLTFDCDCFNFDLSGSVFDSGGNEYQEVDEIVVTAL